MMMIKMMTMTKSMNQRRLMWRTRAASIPRLMMRFTFLDWIGRISFVDEYLDHDVSPYRMSYIAL